MSKENSSTCPRCKGTGFRHVDGMEGVVKCECLKENRPERLLRDAAIPRKYADCRLDNYDTSPQTPYLEFALIKAKGYVDQYFTKPTPKGLLFQGTPGLGKTHLAVGIIRKLIEMASITCFFCNFAAELQRIRDSMSSNKTLALPRLVYDAEIVVLDDFGIQRWSDWVQEQVSNVISNRYDNGRATIITTNLPDKPSEERQSELIAKLKSLGVMNAKGEIDQFQKRRLEEIGIRITSAVREEPETLEDQIGDRLRSRLYEMCDAVPMGGDDYRRLEAGKRRSRDIFR